MTITPQMAEAFKKIDAIDLTNCMQRLQDPKKGKGWSQSKAKEMERKYRNFLKLIAAGQTVVPTLDLDEVWHTHVLDTRNYMEDCKRCFGHYVHHNPYGMEQSQLDDGFARTGQAYKELFGEDYSTPKGKRA